MAQSNPTDSEIRESYHEHGARTQLHRWYQYYENSNVGLENQLDILAKNIHVKSSNGEVNNNIDEYAKAVVQLPSTWQNAHNLHDLKIQVLDNKTLNLTANITYTNVGIMPDGTAGANAMVVSE